VPGIALDFRDRRQRFAFGLAEIEDGARPVAEKHFIRDLLDGFFWLAFPPENRYKDGDAFFSLADVPSELVPGVKSRDVRRGRFL
jgi:hypothetical protein